MISADKVGIPEDVYAKQAVNKCPTTMRSKWPYFSGYFHTFPAIMRITEIVFMLVAFCMSLVEKQFLETGGSWLVLTTTIAFLSSILFLIFHLFLLHRFVAAPWILIEFVAGTCVGILLFSGGVLSAAYSHLGSVMIAQTVFLFLALAIYIVNGLINFKTVQAGRYYE